jgi:hypothetical protein
MTRSPRTRALSPRAILTNLAIILAIGRAMVIQEEPQPAYQIFVL